MAVCQGMAAESGNRPQWLVNVTNDAWFGTTAGPHQHFHQARLCAVEEGLPIARAANTGISAMIDGYGRVVARRDLGEQGVVDTSLPVALPKTLYARFGDWAAFTLMLGFLATFILSQFIISRRHH